MSVFTYSTVFGACSSFSFNLYIHVQVRRSSHRFNLHFYSLHIIDGTPDNFLTEQINFATVCIPPSPSRGHLCMLGTYPIIPLVLIFVMRREELAIGRRECIYDGASVVADVQTIAVRFTRHMEVGVLGIVSDALPRVEGHLVNNSI